MRRRKVRWAAVLLLTALLAVGACVLWPRPNRITPANFVRIEEGMSRAEVVSVLGPSNDYSSGPLIYVGDITLLFSFPGPHATGDFVPSSSFNFGDVQTERVEWRNDEQIVHVYFLPSGHVHTMCRYDVRPIELSPLDGFLWRAKRQWRKWFPES
jgi:hypothetical protein